MSTSGRAASSLGCCAAKLKTGRGGGGGGAKRDASAAAWSAYIGAGGAATSTPVDEKGVVLQWPVTTAMLFDDDDGAAMVVVAAAGGEGLVLPLFVMLGDEANERRGLLASVVDVGVDGADEAATADEEEGRLALRQPPPTGTLRRTPPLVQYRRQLLQKWRGCDRL
jgi:hypothetical protein